MIIGKVNIDGKNYALAVTMRVAKNCQDRTGNSLYKEVQALAEDIDVKRIMPLMCDMLNAGYKAAQAMGSKFEEPPEAEALYDTIGYSDLIDIIKEIARVISGKPDFETKTKNA